MRRLLCALGTLVLGTSVGCTSIADTHTGERPSPQTSLCTTGLVGQAINSTGKVPDGCVKIEGSAIGKLPQTLTFSGITVELKSWEGKGGSRGEFIGFTVAASADIAFAVKAGTATFAGTGTTWIHPNGTTGSAAKAISNVTFCPAEPLDAEFPEGNNPGGENPAGELPIEELPGQGGETPNEGGETPNEGGETPNEGGETPNEGVECPPFPENPGQGTPPEGKPAGESCAQPSECVSGICNDSTCVPGEPGAACISDGDCSTNNCENYLCEQPAAGEGTEGSGEIPFGEEPGSGGTTTPGVPAGGSGDGAGGDEGGSTGSDPAPELAGAGAACTQPAQCYSGSCDAGFCEGNTSGEPCRASTDCSSGVTCVEGLCVGGIL